MFHENRSRRVVAVVTGESKIASPIDYQWLIGLEELVLRYVQP